jgi:hypothetical protein
MTKIINPAAVEYAKQLIKDIRADIKTQIPHTLPDITYEVIRVQKNFSQVIQIRFDGSKFPSIEKMSEVSKKIKQLYGKYSNYTGLKTDDILISVFNSVKGKWAETYEIKAETMLEHFKKVSKQNN